MKSDTRTRARYAILSDMLSFPTVRHRHWHSDLGFDGQPQVGDLISLSSAPVSKWYISWLLEIDPNEGWPKYLLESIEDGSLCWWENVGLNWYDRERVANNPTWKWTDKQFDFYDKWNKVCYRRHDAWHVLPMLPVFNPDDDSVTLNLRIRHGFSDFHYPQVFNNWKKITMKQMSEYYLAGCEAYHKYEEKQNE